MKKFFAVVKREYLQRVRTKMFILMTVLAPLMMSFFGLVPALIFSIKTGAPMKIAVVDNTGRLYGGLSRALTDERDETDSKVDNVTGEEDRARQLSASSANNIELQQVVSAGSGDSVKLDLNSRLRSKELNGYLVLPADLFDGGSAEFVGRNSGDVFTKRILQQALNRAIREERLKQAKIDEQMIARFSRPVDLQMSSIDSRSGEHDSGEGFVLVFVAGFAMYLTILMYGQVVLGAIIEEKETRIAEILFSSVRPFTLLIGKLVGVSLVALTQLCIWGIAVAAFAAYGVSILYSRGVPVHLPRLPLINFLYFGLFFLMGYFVYATLYALVGSMVSTAQEGGQLAMPIVLVLVIGFYLFLPVSRNPDSSFSFWVSMVPFFAPVTMMVRIVTQRPPLWEILTSLVVGFGTIIFFNWVASRIYRVGMLMYGKRARFSEVAHWVRQR